MGTFSKLSTVFHTVKYLKPIQIVSQLKGRLGNRDSFDNYGRAVSVANIDLCIPEMDLSPSYLARFDLSEMAEGRVTLLHHTFTLGSWHDDTASHLENFNLHYFEYAIALAAAGKLGGDEKYLRLLRELTVSWQECRNSADAKHPYTVSLRTVNLLTAGTLLGDREIIASVYPQYRYLTRHLETNLLGNHYFENLKTAVIGSVIFGEDTTYKKYIGLLLRELKEQVLPDGVHYELSPMYHKIVLEGLIRTAYVLKQAEKTEYNALLPFIEKMVTAAYSLEKDMGRTPLFNDSGDNVAKELPDLLLAAEHLFGIRPNCRNAFPESGYYKLYSGDIAILLDAGKIGPAFMPGHGHCDCLSFELSVGKVPILVNSGTGYYQGQDRGYFRSTSAHNTLMLGEIEQSECWGEHRVARRIRRVGAKSEENTVVGSFTDHLGNGFCRTWHLEGRTLTVTDSVTPQKDGTVHAYLHFADGAVVTENGNGVKVFVDGKPVCGIECGSAEIQLHTDGPLTRYAPEFGPLKKASCVEMRWDSKVKTNSFTINFT